jgi:hypothetical protein
MNIGYNTENQYSNVRWSFILKIRIENNNSTQQLDNTKLLRFFYMPAIKQSIYFSFDSSVAPMTYADQYIEITITVPTSKLYGLGEHTGPLLLKPEEGPKLSFWTRDQPPNVSSKN